MKALSKDQCELLVAHLVQLGILQLDFGYTAYSTNTYLKAAARGNQMLAGGAFSDAMQNAGETFGAHTSSSRLVPFNSQCKASAHQLALACTVTCT